MVWYTTVTIMPSKKGVQVKRREPPQKAPRYRSFVVRCWQEQGVHAGRETMVWRYSLQNAGTDQRRGFATLEALLVSMQAELSDGEID